MLVSNSNNTLEEELNELSVNNKTNLQFPLTQLNGCQKTFADFGNIL